MAISEIIRYFLSTIGLLVFLYLGFRKNQNSQQNWALFYATLWTLVTLPIIDFTCIKFNLWRYNSETSHVPFDLFFSWIVYWGILPMLIFKGKKVLLVTMILLWLDLATMPLFEHFEILILGPNWLLGESFLIIIVFIPGYYWGRLSLTRSSDTIRAIFQVLTMGLSFLVLLPAILSNHGLADFQFREFNGFNAQLVIMISIPAFAAVQALVKKGKGTPFPYDKTSRLVRSGVYAYCRNPIQWSFTLLFIPLAIHFQSLYLLGGSIVSIAYVIGVANIQESPDMLKRFSSDWQMYRQSVSPWLFSWKPKSHPTGTIYFKKDCVQCSQLNRWFQNRDTTQLHFEYADDFPGTILQVTYVDEHGNVYRSVGAIAEAFQHINLAWASLGWFMALPPICFVLQAIVDSVDVSEKKTHN